MAKAKLDSSERRTFTLNPSQNNEDVVSPSVSTHAQKVRRGRSVPLRSMDGEVAMEPENVALLA
ncbi:hypothetical protein AKJ08_0048 [Vulgatibacter incomptus]|uniref:Uncharacterized protein n=1 Tax=Vulgatibacter incomptus TaxID=1391653 RepID=A0A0K1P899_9BACT|nr:hypothetical protein AKJ08_0048 [Vulgatibacter incomptus]